MSAAGSKLRGILAGPSSLSILAKLIRDARNRAYTCKFRGCAAYHRTLKERRDRVAVTWSWSCFLVSVGLLSHAYRARRGRSIDSSYRAGYGLHRWKASPKPDETSRAFWEPKEDLLGLFDIWSFRRIEAVVSSGLGGGSLIYANVFLRKDEHWFVKDSPLPGGGYENWPISRERPRASLRRRSRDDQPAAVALPGPSQEQSPPRSGPETRARGVFSPTRCDVCPTWRDRRAKPADTGASPTGTSTAFLGSPAGFAASATSGAMKGPRTRWTTPTCPPRNIMEQTFAPSPR